MGRVKHWRVGSAVSVRIHRGALGYSAAMIMVLLVGAGLPLTMGRFGIAPSELPGAILSGGEGQTGFVLRRLRGPRLVTAGLVGSLLGLSGYLFQTVTRNPLGSPDVIGLGAAAGAGVALSALVFTSVPTALAAAGGAAIGAFVVFVSTGKGFRSPTRTIIAGIGVAAGAHAVTQYVVSVKLRDAAAHLAAYLVGSLNAVSWDDVTVTGLSLAVFLPLSVAIAPHIRLLEMGDDVAAALGSYPERMKTVAIVIAVMAAGAAVSAAGPISFVALTAPQIAKRMIGSSESGAIPAALTGAVILVMADLGAQQIGVLSGLPVGVVTLGVGGAYLGYLLLALKIRGRI